MYQDYYHYGKEELLKNPRLPLIVMEDNETVFRSIAEEMSGRTISIFHPIGQ